MSGLVDMWTSESAKAREKGRAPLEGGSSHPVEPSREVGSEQPSAAAAASSSSLLAFQAKRWPTVLIYSETALSMLMECFSP